MAVMLLPENEEFIVALSGAFDVIVDDGVKKENLHIEPLRIMVYMLPAGLWREMENFSTNSLALNWLHPHYDRRIISVIIKNILK